MFWRKTKIERMCRQTGRWAVINFDKQDNFTVRSVRTRTVYPINVRHHPKRTTTRFQTWLPVRFPLGNPPPGLFGKLLLRSWDLSWSGWCLNIVDSCEATACVTALVPSMALDAVLFDAICQEQTEEVAAFHQELRDKFNYAGQFGGGYAAAEARQAGPGVPMLRPDNPLQRYR